MSFSRPQSTEPNDGPAVYTGLAPLRKAALLCAEEDRQTFRSKIYKNTELGDYYLTNRPSPKGKFISYLDIIIRDLLLFKCPEVSEDQILKLLNSKVDPDILDKGITKHFQPFYDATVNSYSQFKIEFVLTVKRLAFALLHREDKAPVEFYQDVCEILKDLSYWQQKLVLRNLESIIGKVEHLAKQQDDKNFNYIMSKMKLSISLPLLYTFATAPTIVGKCVAVWQFLEVHGLIWQSTPWEKIQQVIAFFYKILGWIMQKCEVLYDLAGEFVEYVKPKCWKEKGQQLPIKLDKKLFEEQGVGIPDDKPAELQVSGDSPTMQGPISLQCSVCNRMGAVIGCQHGYHACAFCNRVGMWCPVAMTPGTQPCHTHSMAECNCSEYNSIPSCTPESSSMMSEVEEVDLPVTPISTNSPVDWYDGQEHNYFTAPRVDTPPGVNPFELTEKLETLLPKESWTDKIKHTVEDGWSSAKNFISNLKIDEIGSSFLAWLEHIVGDVIVFFDEHPLASGLLALSSAVTSLLGFSMPVLFGGKQIATFVKKLADGLRCAYYANRGTEGILSAFTGLTNTVRTCLGVSPDKAVQEFKQRISEMAVVCREMLDTAIKEPGKFINDSQQFGMFKRRMISIQQVYVDLAKQTDTRSLAIINPIWNNLTKTYYDLCDKFQKLVSCTSERQEPVCIWLYGRSDIGKSTFLSWLADEINRKTGRSLQVFTMCKGPEFWNGYAQQGFIKIDDFASWLGPEGLTDALAVFNLITNAAYNPNMAALADKNTMVTSLFLLIAANMPTVPLNSGIQDIEAFERRRHLFIHAEWPEHERDCAPGTRDCTHWADVKKKNKDNITDFSHLRFTMCNPLVSQPTGRVVRCTAKDKRTTRRCEEIYVKSKERIIREGVEVTQHEIVDEMIRLENEHRATFEKVMQRKKDSGSLLQSEVTSWKKSPNVLLSGPPGIGKTYIMDLLKQKRPDIDPSEKPIFINNVQDFESFMQRTSFSEDNSIVYFHDLSGLQNSKFFKPFIETVISRADSTNTKSLWVMCANNAILDQKLFELFGNNFETVNYFHRRCEEIKFSYRKRFTLKGMRPYTCADVKNEPKKIESMVDRTLNGTTFSVGQIVDVLLKYKLEVQTEVYHDHPVMYDTFDPDSTVRILMTTAEFLELCNNETPMGVASTLVRGKAKIGESKIPFTTLANKLFYAVNASKAGPGTVNNVEAMLVEAWNMGYLNSFAGDKYLVAFNDKAYVLDGSKEPIVLGVLKNEHDDVDSVISSINTSLRSIETADLLGVSSNLLPPWVTLVGDTIMSVAKTIATGLVTYAAISAESSKQKALAITQKVEKITSDYCDEQLMSIPQVLDDTLKQKYVPIQQTDPEAQPKMFAPRRQTDPEAQPKMFAPRRQTDPTAQPKIFAPTRQVDPDAPVGVQAEQKELECELQAATPKIQQVVNDPGIPAVIDKIMWNMVEVITTDNKFLCYGVMTKGKLGTTVGHVRDRHKGDFLIRTSKNQVFPVEVIKREPTIDRLDFKITDKSAPEFPDITHHFSAVDAPPSYTTEGVLMTVMVKDKMPILKLRTYLIKSMEFVDFDEDPNKYYHITYTGHKAGTEMVGPQTYAGDCGSLLLICDPNWQHGKVIGMHVGAGSVKAYARIMCREHYKDDKQQARAVNGLPCFDTPHLKTVTDPLRRANGLLAITRNKQHVPTQTKLYRNLIPIGPRIYEPAILSRNDLRNPDCNVLRDEAAKWRIKRRELTPQEEKRFEHAMDGLASYYAAILAREGVVLRTLTRMEAANKLSGCSKSEPINIKTSAGFPFMDMTKRRGKQEFLNRDENGILHLQYDNEQGRYLKTAMDAYSEELHGRGKAMCIFKVFLKDEPLKLKKIYDSVRTRTIAGAPLDFQIVYRQYVHAGQANLAENWHVLPPKIGINASSLDWNTMFHNLAKVSPVALEEDFKGWDFCTHPFMIGLLPKFWNYLYKKLDPNWKPEDDQMRNILYSKVQNFLMLVGCSVFQATGGIPSGYPGTAIDNTIINNLIHLVLYEELMERVNPKLSNVFSFFQDCSCVGYGDDWLMTLSHFFQKHWNARWWTDRMKYYGFEVTSACKEDEQLRLRPLIECSFMSRSFKRVGMFYLGPLNLERLYKTSWWVHDSPPHNYSRENELVAKREENILGAYECMLYEAVLHGEEVFELVYDTACAARDKLRSDIIFPDYKAAYSRLLGESPLPTTSMMGVMCFNELPMIENVKLNVTPPEFVKTFPLRTSYHYGPPYSYTGVQHPGALIPESLKRVMDNLNQKYDRNWNSILVNRYGRGGAIPWHKDDEESIDVNEGVGCLTIKGDGLLQILAQNGQTQEFNCFKGMFYIMNRQNLLHFKHRRVEHNAEETISLTFRKLTTSFETSVKPNVSPKTNHESYTSTIARRSYPRDRWDGRNAYGSDHFRHRRTGSPSRRDPRAHIGTEWN